MPTFTANFSIALRVLGLTAALMASGVRADEYTDVSNLMRAGQSAEALAKIEQYLSARPRDPQMRFLKGVIQTEAGKISDAISTFTKITEDFPELPEPYNNLAVLYAGQNQYDKAKTALEMAIRTNPSYATAHENLGDIYARLASQAYSKALQLDSSSTGVPPKLALIRNLFSDVKAPVKAAASTPIVTPVGPVAVAIKKSPAPDAVSTIAPPPSAAAALPAAPAGADKEVEAAVRAWAEAWASKNMSVYLDSYGSAFVPPKKMHRKAWEEERRLKITGKSQISLNISNLSVSVQGDKASAQFKQKYKAGSVSGSTHKTLNMSKVGSRWVIVKESSSG